MKRDMDTIRSILLACEANPHGYAPDNILADVDDREKIEFHIFLMGQASLLNVTNRRDVKAKSPRAIANFITWEGYEFLEASRDDGRWRNAKLIAGKAGSFTIELLKKILAELAMRAANQSLGA